MRPLAATVVFCLVASMAFAQSLELQPGERLEKLEFPAATMQLKGWTKFGNGRVYTLPVKAGQHVKVSFSTKSKFTFLSIFDLATPDEEAIFGTDEDGESYNITVKESTTWLLRPYYSKVSPRRGLGAPYSILVEPQAAAPPQPVAPAEQQSPSPLFPPRQ
ncbi:hypothetical protein QO004_001393 [Rhizobium mesoamericanum]|uniref:hypothetical protein n=1 Tax=Rhizobium mesoamericanum TaxID=1079800 RepID=UPI002785CCB3|nr:hypothetical protein [Rhizobium mesoamericanum]MDQ0559615.1 hypothetical protein [Rhizobium mesoamericanum]